MVTYLYWILVIALSIAICWVAARFFKWRIGISAGLIVFVVGWSAYYFHYEQLFVKNYGGVMSLTVPEGQMHLSATWKEDHLWIENYDPRTNTCHFNEYSRGHLLQGQVVIENCNPVIPGKN